MILVNFGDELCHGLESAGAIIAADYNLGFIDTTVDDEISNISIYKKIINFCIDVENTSNYIFLIGWTKSDRLEFADQSRPFTFIKEKYKYKNQMFKKLNKFNHFLFEPILVSETRLSYVNVVQQTLESRGIRYFMYNTQDQIEYNKYTKTGLKNINNQFYFNALEKKDCMISYLKRNNIKNNQPSGRVWADLLSKKMRASGVLQK